MWREGNGDGVLGVGMIDGLSPVQSPGRGIDDLAGFFYLFFSPRASYQHPNWYVDYLGGNGSEEGGEEMISYRRDQGLGAGKGSPRSRCPSRPASAEGCGASAGAGTRVCLQRVSSMAKYASAEARARRRFAVPPFELDEESLGLHSACDVEVAHV